MTDRFYIDCEFDGHGGPLLSIAMVPEDGGLSLHVRTNETARDPWVIENVVPLLDQHDADLQWSIPAVEVGDALRHFLEHVESPTIIADSPVDIGRFCTAISTGPDGGWASCDYPKMTFEVHNVDCYPTTLPGAVQHNAWWDAMALRHKLTAQAGETGTDETRSAAYGLSPEGEHAVTEGHAPNLSLPLRHPPNSGTGGYRGDILAASMSVISREEGVRLRAGLVSGVFAALPNHQARNSRHRSCENRPAFPPPQPHVA